LGRYDKDVSKHDGLIMAGLDDGGERRIFVDGQSDI
jgi:hypothetical protein